MDMEFQKFGRGNSIIPTKSDLEWEDDDKCYCWECGCEYRDICISFCDCEKCCEKEEDWE